MNMKVYLNRLKHYVKLFKSYLWRVNLKLFLNNNNNNNNKYNHNHNYNNKHQKYYNVKIQKIQLIVILMV